MFVRDRVREAIGAQYEVSEHLKVKRILFQTRRPFTEMLEGYRAAYAPTDRDNDPLFIHYLIDRGWENRDKVGWLQDCPWEVERDEPLSSQYPLNLSIPDYQEIESLSLGNGWTLQRATSALVYTGLLSCYAVRHRGDKVRLQVLRYPHAPYQPNEEYLNYQGEEGVIAKKTNPRMCWESVKLRNVSEPIAIRKDWIKAI
jgi:hypothetical protein